MEREIGHSILHDSNGPIYLDELDPSARRMADEIMEGCSIFCSIAIQDVDSAIKEIQIIKKNAAIEEIAKELCNE